MLLTDIYEIREELFLPTETFEIKEYLSTISLAKPR
jgi:hypothetical protein